MRKTKGNKICELFSLRLISDAIFTWIPKIQSVFFHHWINVLFKKAESHLAIDHTSLFSYGKLKIQYLFLKYISEISLAFLNVNYTSDYQFQVHVVLCVFVVPVNYELPWDVSPTTRVMIDTTVRRPTIVYIMMMCRKSNIQCFITIVSWNTNCFYYSHNLCKTIQRRNSTTWKE